MDHEYFKDRISAFYDGELKHEEEHMIAEHLKNCPECRQLFDDLKHFDEKITQYTSLGESDYWEKSAQKIEQAIGLSDNTTVTDIKTSAPSKGLWWKITAVAASIAVIAFIALYEGEIKENVLNAPSVVRMPKTGMAQKDSSEYRETRILPQADMSPKSIAVKPENQEKDELGDVAPESPVAVVEKSEPMRTDTKPSSLSETRDKEEKSKTVKKVLPQPKPEINTYAEETINKPQRVAGSVEDSDLSLPDVFTETLSKVTDRKSTGESEVMIPTLQQWRDSLVVLNKSHLSNLQTTKSQLSNSMVEVSDKNDREYLILECHYNIAYLTEDTVEYNKSLKYLNEYVADTDAHYIKEAREFLDKLKQK